MARRHKPASIHSRPSSPTARSTMDDENDNNDDCPTRSFLSSPSLDTDAGSSADDVMDDTFWPALLVNDNSPESISESEEDELFKAELQKHKQTIQDGAMDEAIRSFILLESKGLQSETFLEYLIEITENIGPNRDSDLSRFFASLPGLIQQTIIERVSVYLEEVDSRRSFQVLYDYIISYPRHAYKYLIRTIDQLVLYIRSIEVMDPTECEDYERILVTDLLKRLSKQRVQLADKDRLACVRFTYSKHFIVVAYNAFEHYLLIGLRYHIRHHQWNDMNKFASRMLECCGYSGLGRPSLRTHLARFEIMKEQRPNIRLDTEGWMDETLDDRRRQPPEDLRVLIAFMCEFIAVSVQFIQFGYDYYRAICITHDAQREDTCLIPICSMDKLKQHSRDSDEDMITPTNDLSTETKRPSKKRKRHAEVSDRGEGLESICMKGVDCSLRILSSAGDCLRHLVSLWDWGVLHAPKTNWENVIGGWEQELARVIESCRLPFNIYNAVLLVRGDLALSMPSITGNLAKALELSQKICDRIEVQRRMQRASVKKIAEYDMPFMFAFRVLYSIGIIYLVSGDVKQSIVDIAIILSVFPIPNDLNEADFLADETDCRTAATVFNGRDFGLMRVTRRGLIARCMKHLIISIDSEKCNPGLHHKSTMMAANSERSQDDQIGSTLVLMQYGWSFWASRTSYWRKSLQHMQDKGIFKNHDFLEFIYTPEILRTFLALHMSDKVAFDIVAPEYAYQTGYSAVASGPYSAPLSPPTAGRTDGSAEMMIDPSASSCDEEESIPTSSSGLSQETSSSSYSMTSTPAIYRPVRMMSASWYTTSVQKAPSHAGRMSPSYYSSHPTTLAAASAAAAATAARPSGAGVWTFSSASSSSSSSSNNSVSSRSSGSYKKVASLSSPPHHHSSSSLPKQVTTHHLTNGLRCYSGSNQCTQSLMRENLQKFLKSVVLKSDY